MTATVGTATYIYEKSGVTFTNGQYYEITVKMTDPLIVPLTIEALSDGSSITVSSPQSGMQYSTDGGQTKTARSGGFPNPTAANISIYNAEIHHEGGTSATADGAALLIPAKEPARPIVACKARTRSLLIIDSYASKNNEIVRSA